MPQCPSCNADSVYRSRTRSAWERWRRQVTMKCPFRCHACGRRFWRPDPGPFFSREEIEAANRAIASPFLEETITVPAAQPADRDLKGLEELQFGEERRTLSEPEIAALDRRFSRPKQDAASYDPQIPNPM